MKTGKNSIKEQMGDVISRATKTLKKEGKFTPLYEMQLQLASMLMARVHMIMDEMEKDDYSIRQGLKVNPLEKLLLDYTDRAMKALKGLGMNTDSKDVKADGDSLTDFMSEFGGEQ